MQQEALVLEEVAEDTSDGDIFHLYCCDENLGLCGFDLSEASEGFSDNDQFCIVCEELELSEEYACPKCNN